VIDASVARRYARALLSLALDEDRHEQYGDELQNVHRALQQNRELSLILQNPGYSQSQRHAAIDALASALELSPTVVNFLRLLLDRQRIGDIAAVDRAYRAMLDQQVGRVRATVTAARTLSEDQLERLRDAIGRMTGRTILLESKTDPSLIGGVVTQVGATMLDGSLRTQLERMRAELKHTPITNSGS
jgi:F-type H+-transporting ATPase subunit delta